MMADTSAGRLAATLLAVGALLAGCSAADDAPTAGLPPIMLEDLEGRTVQALPDGGSSVTVFLFVRTDCPISNRYAPEVRRIHEAYAPRGVRFRLVYLDREQTVEQIREHMREYDYPFDALRDPDHALVRRTGARVTPEAAVLTAAGELAYRGRIDDLYVDFGKTRAEPTVHDLTDALAAVLEGRTVPNPRTDAVGCFIPDLR